MNTIDFHNNDVSCRPDVSLEPAVALSLVPGIGPRLCQQLIAHFGSPSAVLQQSPSALRQVPGIGQRAAAGICDVAASGAAAAVIAECRSADVRITTYDSDGYPERLREIDDAPPVLYQRGALRERDDLAIAIVGSRRCTLYGRRQAERLAGSLARAGFTIVSGLARGIDTAAHRGALNAGGRTLAILAAGVRDIYPQENTELAESIVGSGALLSEYPLDQKPRPGLFPQRNRIISGMSLGVIVVEATRTSGSLYTARHAMEQGREVFAVPGPVDSLASAGCHQLIRDGATLIRHMDDVLQELGPLAGPSRSESGNPVHHPRELVLNAFETEVLSHVSTHANHIDDILRAIKADPSRVMATLTILEVRRLVRRLPGGNYARYN